MKNENITMKRTRLVEHKKQSNFDPRNGAVKYSGDDFRAQINFFDVEMEEKAEKRADKRYQRTILRNRFKPDGISSVKRMKRSAGRSASGVANSVSLLHDNDFLGIETSGAHHQLSIRVQCPDSARISIDDDFHELIGLFSVYKPEFAC